MLVLVCIVHLWIRFCFTFPLKARRGLQRQNCSQQNFAQANNTEHIPTPRSVSLPGVGLRAVLVTFGFSENLIVDSAQC